MAQDTVEQNPVEDKQKTETSQEAEKRDIRKDPLRISFISTLPGKEGSEKPVTQ